MNSPHYKLGQMAHDHPEIDGFSLPEYLDPAYPQTCAVCGKRFTPGTWIVLMARITYYVECFQLNGARCAPYAECFLFKKTIAEENHRSNIAPPIQQKTPGRETRGIY
ncbi:MAG: hypothetical protein JRD68_11120 [Deltaproteobacteria bacterium]|nr:hypothetical protein [Deltaproteobacteria bacterium]